MGEPTESAAELVVKLKEQLKRQRENFEESYRIQGRDLAVARERAERLRCERDGEVWMWSGDPEEDNVESLVCPVLMSAAQAREMSHGLGDPTRQSVRKLKHELKALQRVVGDRDSAFQLAQENAKTVDMHPVTRAMVFGGMRIKPGEAPRDTPPTTINEMQEIGLRWLDNVPPDKYVVEITELLVRIHRNAWNDADRHNREKRNPWKFDLGEVRRAAQGSVHLSGMVNAIDKGTDPGLAIEATLINLASSEKILAKVALRKAETTPPSVTLKRFVPGFDFDAFQKEHGEWSNRLFPGQSEQSMISHLRDEAGCDRCGVGELHVDCNPYELADIVMIACAIVTKRSLVMSELLKEKFAIVKTRKYVQDGGQGFPAHVKPVDIHGLVIRFLSLGTATQIRLLREVDVVVGKWPAAVEEKTAILKKVAAGDKLQELSWAIDRHEGKSGLIDCQPGGSACRCRCHVDPDVRHVMACCDQPPARASGATSRQKGE